MKSQPSTHRCECGQQVPVLQVAPREFTWTCDCGKGRRLSWTRTLPPPLFTPAQPTLFDAPEKAEAVA